MPASGVVDEVAMKKLVAIRRSHQKSLQRIESFLNEYDHEVHGVQNLKVRLDALEQCEREFNECQLEICLSFSDERLCEQEEISDKFYIVYFRVKASLHEHLGQSETTLKEITAVSQPEKPFQIRLPEFKISTFDGSFQNWPTFKEMFSSIIGIDNRLSAQQKLYYLRGHVSGDAKKLVENIEMSADGYKQAWAALNKRYC